jgi:hypothetical protein
VHPQLRIVKTVPLEGTLIVAALFAQFVTLEHLQMLDHFRALLVPLAGTVVLQVLMCVKYALSEDMPALALQAALTALPGNTPDSLVEYV